MDFVLRPTWTWGGRVTQEQLPRRTYFAGEQDLNMDVLISREHMDVRSDVRSYAVIRGKTY